jgi:hypothetical protein
LALRSCGEIIAPTCRWFDHHLLRRSFILCCIVCDFGTALRALLFAGILFQTQRLTCSHSHTDACMHARSPSHCWCAACSCPGRIREELCTGRHLDVFLANATGSTTEQLVRLAPFFGPLSFACQCNTSCVVQPCSASFAPSHSRVSLVFGTQPMLYASFRSVRREKQPRLNCVL